MTANLLLPSSDAVDWARLGPSLGQSLEGLIADGVPVNTARTYVGVWGRFDEWCAERGLRSGASGEPVSAAALGGYLAHLAERAVKVQPSTMQHVVSVITKRESLRGRNGLAGDVAEVASRAIKGYVRRREFKPSQKAYPLVPERIREVSLGLDYNTFVGLRAGLILSIGYSLALRVSEWAAMRIGDITPAPDGGLTGYIFMSKTDQRGRGEKRPIPAGNFVRTDPVTRLREYLEALASYGHDITDPTLPLLRSVTRTGKPRPLTRKADSVGTVRSYGGMTDDSVGLAIRDACRVGGHPQWELVSGHSPRTGYATASAFALIPQAAWSAHGRWSLTSRIPQLYVRDAGIVSNNPLLTVGV